MLVAIDKDFNRIHIESAVAKELHTISVDDVMTIMGYSISWTNLPYLK